MKDTHNFIELFHKQEQLLNIQLPPKIKPLLILCCEMAMRRGYNLAIRDLEKGKKLVRKKYTEEIITP